MPILKVRASNYLAQFVRYQAYKSLLWPIVGHFKFDQVENFQSISLPETAHFVL